MDNLSKTSRLVHCLAGQQASELGFDVVEPNHIFLGLCQGATLTPAFLREFTDLVAGHGPSREELVEKFGQLGALFTAHKLEPEALQSEFAGFLGPGLFARRTQLAEQIFSVDRECFKLFRQAARLANESGSIETEPVHLLWALLNRSGLVRAFLCEVEIDVNALEADCRSQARPLSISGSPTIALVPRPKEVLTLAQALVRMDRTAVAVIGEEGIGRTSLVKAFALALAEGDLPIGLMNHLRGKRVVQVDPSGEMTLHPDQILFVDDFHHHWPELRQHLLSSGVPFIGVSTPQDFQRVVGGDAGRFEQVLLDEPEQEEALRMVAARGDALETHYGLRISTEALEAAVKLSYRYLPHSRLPEKAFNTLHQACVASLSTQQEVTLTTVAEVVAANSKLPLERIAHQTGPASSKLRRELEDTIIGQQDAIEKVTETLARAHHGLSAPERPDAVFLLLGPTGVGKTELARCVGKGLVGEDRFFHFDMSEYGSAHEAARLIGAPPGYVGHERSGRLSEVVRKNPYCVLLFDEIEKAHPQVLDLFLQIFDEGRLVDNQGRKIDFRHTTIFMTSNLGAPTSSNLGFRNRETFEEEEVRKNARKAVRPELWNRIDEVLVFRPLCEDSARKIAANLVSIWDRRLRLSRNVGIELTPSALDLLVKRGYSPELGAREMRRAVEREVTGLVSRWLERAAGTTGSTLRIDASAESLVIR